MTEAGPYSVRRESFSSAAAHAVDRDVVGVLVRDQHRRHAVQGLLDLAEHARVDRQVALAVVQAHARVGELGQLHQMSRSSSTMWTAASSALAA